MSRTLIPVSRSGCRGARRGPRQALDQDLREAPGHPARDVDDRPDDARGRGHARQGPPPVREGRLSRIPRVPRSRPSPRSASTPRWWAWRARRCEGTGVAVASVSTGFPAGQTSLAVKVEETRDAVAAGASEIDMVISREAYLSGDDARVAHEIVAVKEACGSAHLKVILETARTADLRARAPRLAARDRRRRRRDQDVDRQGRHRRDAGRRAGDARDRARPLPAHRPGRSA